MTLKELKEVVQGLISHARTKDAIEKIIKWAKDNNQEQLKKDTSLLKGDFAGLSRERMLGLLSNQEATIRQNQIVHRVLNLLDSVVDINEIPGDDMDKDVITPTGKVKILMLTANPAKTAKLNLDKEYATITQKLQEKQDFFNITLKKAVSGTEFKEYTQQNKPTILHFAGHGTAGKYAGIVVQNDDKNEQALIPIAGLKSLFKFFKKRFNIQVVLLNACHTQEQAATISEYVDYVIGTNVAIGDTAASAFSSGFYFQLAEDNQMNIEDAFESGRTEAVMKGAEEEHFVMYHKGELIPY